jgi:hypothetical protein
MCQERWRVSGGVRERDQERERGDERDLALSHAEVSISRLALSLMLSSLVLP